jgi:hypothetical protein
MKQRNPLELQLLAALDHIQWQQFFPRRLLSEQWFLRVRNKMILDICFLHSTDSNCGCDCNSSTGPTILEFIFRRHPLTIAPVSAGGSAIPPDANDLVLRLRAIKTSDDAAVLTDMSTKLRRAGIFALEDLQGLSLEELKEAVAVLSLNAVQLRRLFTAVSRRDTPAPQPALLSRALISPLAPAPALGRAHATACICFRREFQPRIFRGVWRALLNAAAWRGGGLQHSAAACVG